MIARMFPAEVVNVGTYFGRLKNVESELEITIGIMLGRKQARDWLRHKTPPVRWTIPGTVDSPTQNQCRIRAVVPPDPSPAADRRKLYKVLEVWSVDKR